MSDSVHTLEDQNVLTIKLVGSLNETQSLTLEDVFANKMDGKHKAVIDFEKVSDISPEGVRVLLNAFIKWGETGLVFKNPNNDVKQFLHTVGLANLVSD